MEHFILLVKVVLISVIPDMTTSTQQALMKRNLETSSAAAARSEIQSSMFAPLPSVSSDSQHSPIRTGGEMGPKDFSRKLQPMLKTSKSIRVLKADQERMYVTIANRSLLLEKSLRHLLIGTRNDYKRLSVSALVPLPVKRLSTCVLMLH
jgi:hypothetical protein